ncbi:Aurora kinase A [Tetrabaena socialis]|uniref:Aurora kinase A n=1 Tax=Tetrabaena socialis TaxID=47790 RepID=A0A2J8A7Z1_9CHLO|nr:Aurora kinase A [Tetrabaena socialis]|eukprot:PNH08646.1 Aurora kinase A [Tetrabaena socialis]
MVGPGILAVSPNLPSAMERQAWSLKDYRILTTLYSGYAAQVYTATCHHSGVEVVLKVYADVDKAPDVAQHEMFREVAIQSGLQHPNVVHLFAAFQESNTLVLVQEYAPNGDLLALMHSHGGCVDEVTVVQVVLRPLLEAVLYLHRWGVVHRDLKPENVLFAADGTIKLADFGLAINMVEERPISRVGTLDYMSPEVLRCPVKQSMAMAPGPSTSARYGFATDVWAVGIVAFELLTGLPPYASECRHEAEHRICAASPPLFPRAISHMARDIILRMLAPRPADRPTVRQLLDHPWIRDPEACVPRPIVAAPMPVFTPVPQHVSYNDDHTYAHCTPAPAPHHPHPHALPYSHASAHVHPSASGASLRPHSPPSPAGGDPMLLGSSATLPYAHPLSQGQQQLAAAQLAATPPPPAVYPAGSALPVASAADNSSVQRHMIDQLRGLQQQQLMDLSKLPLDQLQGLIQKLQQAAQLAATQRPHEGGVASCDVHMADPAAAAAGSLVHSSCNSPQSPRGTAAAPNTSASCSMHAAHGPAPAAASPFAFAANLASQILHVAPASGTPAADSVSTASEATAYSSMGASRRTTVEGRPRAQNAMVDAVAAALHLAPRAEARTAAVSNCYTQSYSHTVAMCQAQQDAAGGAVSAGQAPSVFVPAGPYAARPMDRSSGGGGLHDGDGLVYVSIGSSRKPGALVQCGEDSLEAARNVATWIKQLATGL